MRLRTASTILFALLLALATRNAAAQGAGCAPLPPPPPIAGTYAPGRSDELFQLRQRMQQYEFEMEQIHRRLEQATVPLPSGRRVGSGPYPGFA